MCTTIYLYGYLFHKDTHTHTQHTTHTRTHTQHTRTFTILGLTEPTGSVLEFGILQIHLHVWSDEHAGD